MDYEKKLHRLQIELVKLQRHVIGTGARVLIILEGRDGAGKDGTIKRLTEHLSPRDIRIVALPKPSDVEATQWYFQRYVEHLPAAGEIVIFNRSWYNRAGVERVMGFCTPHEYEHFLQDAPRLEAMLTASGLTILKYYLDISRAEQKARLTARRQDPLKQWKISPIDEQALQKFDDYTAARDIMLRATDSPEAPWIVVRADDKRSARLAIIGDILARVDYRDAAHHGPDSAVLRRFDETCFADGLLAS